MSGGHLWGRMDWTCMRMQTRLSGATALLPTTPATPPAAACFRDRSSGAKSET